MNKKKRMQVLFWMLLTIQALVSLVSILSIPSYAKNPGILGYSLERLLLIAAILFLSFLSAWLALQSSKQKLLSFHFFNWIDQHEKNLRVAFGIAAVFFAIILLIPATEFGKFKAYYERLVPLITWLFTFTLLVCVWIAINYGTGWSLLRKDQKKKSYRFYLITVAIMGVVWFITQITQLGRTADAFWNEGSVPLQILQVLFAISIGIVFGYITSKTDTFLKGQKNANKIDGLIFVLIWLVTISVWSAQPMLRYPMLTDPSSPNYEYYSYSDGATYDAGARYLSLGQGINNLRSTDKPAYIYFLGILQSIVGLQYEKVILGQTIILALLPAVLYCLGKQLHSRIAGIIAALLGLFLEVNAYQLTLDIQVSHAKLMMTELPTALLLAILVWVFSKYQQIKDCKGKGVWLLILSGGICALAAFTRANAYLAVSTLGVVIFATEKTVKTRIYRSLLFLVGFCLVALPWYVGVSSGLSVIPKIRMITEDRYSITTSQQQNQNENEEQNISSNYDADDGLNSSTPFMIANHFLHNVTGSAMALPLSPLIKLKSIINTPLWDAGWNGKFSGVSVIFMLTNLVIVAIGFASSWTKGKVNSWLPLLIYVSYHLANGFARTSGSRYLVPVEWVVLLYYAIGLSQFMKWGSLWWLKTRLPSNNSTVTIFRNSANKNNKRLIITTIFCLSLIGISMPLSDVLIKDKLVYPSKTEAWNDLKEHGISGYLQQEGFNSTNIEKQILENNRIFIYHGVAMNPRYLRENESIPPVNKLYQPYPITRLTFLGIGQFTAAINLPLQNEPKNFPNGTEFYVIGCAEPEHINWVVNSRSSQTFFIEGLVVTQIQDAQWTYLISPAFEEQSLCP